ncbi:hypothetical protein GYMLUDRAFT_251857 [Collybiopsis luxurians FD-317 M1]|uniref:Uncharacterized protein n=1 Tax=Collybiopsis luxurians FD-317 M1 TaxID=944289 RepID=A0A0D0BQ33_9AGAR|nr:hypothetical protein GYMLUDRAFT_251857 [Collybiopsis luxurians FD-317 M1]
MSSSQAFPNHPIASSSASGGSKPQLIIKPPQPTQSSIAVPLSDALASVPPKAKKMWHTAFECSALLQYPVVPVSLDISSPLPANVQCIFNDVYLANSSPKERRLGLGNPGCKRVVQVPSRKVKEVVCGTVDDDVEMEVLEELDGMNLDYSEEVPPPPTPVSTAPAPIWKAVNTQFYSKVSSLKTWFFEPLVKQVPSDGSSPTQDKMIQTAVECVVTRMASLFAGPRKKMLEQDLWALVDGLIQGAFTGLEEQLQHSPSKPPASFSSKSLFQFIKLLSVVNMTSANIIDSQQDELL